MSLKDGLKNNKLTDFIKERPKEEKRGDEDKFDKVIKSISQTSSKAPKVSAQGSR